MERKRKGTVEGRGDEAKDALDLLQIKLDRRGIYLRGSREMKARVRKDIEEEKR